MAAIKLIIEDNIGNENFSVSYLAKEVGLSRSTLHRKLIRLTGKSATGLITEIRLARAIELIENDVVTISEVAYIVGFTSPSYFNKVFKKAYNVSPGELRKNNSSRRAHQTLSREHGIQDSPRPKRSRFYAIVGTKLLMVFIVAAAAALTAWELIDLISLNLGLPEQTVNIMIVLLCVGIIISIFLSWLYDLQNDVGLSRPSLRLRNPELVVISKRRKITTYISIVFIVALLTMNLIQNGIEVKAMDLREKSIAVLPFHNDSPEQDNEHTIRGMMESITTSLSKIEELKVKPRYAVEQFRDTSLPIPELAEYLNVNYLLMGSVQKYGDQVRLTLRLIDKNGRQIWSDQFVSMITQEEDNFELQSKIAMQVASELHANLTPEEIQILDRFPTINVKALGLYRQGREEHTKFRIDNNDMEALRKATAFYRSALEEDSSYGQAYSGLAMAIHNSFWTVNWRNREFSETEKRLCRDTIMHLANKAINCDPYLEEAFLVKGNYYHDTRDFDRALQEYEHALQINPNCSRAYNAKSDIMFFQKNNWISGLHNKMKAIELEGGDMQVKLLSELGDLYEMMGFSDNAEDVYRHTLFMTADTATYYFDMGGVAFCKQNWTERISWFKKSLELDPDQNHPHIAISESYRILGNIDSACYYAFLLLEKGIVYEKAGDIELTLGMALRDKGQNEKAVEMIDRLEEYLKSLLVFDVGRRDLYLLMLTEVYCFKNQQGEAMGYLRQIDRHTLKPLWWIILLEDYPQYETIRMDPDYQLILNTLKNTWQKEHDKVRLWFEENDVLLSKITT